MNAPQQPADTAFEIHLDITSDGVQTLELLQSHSELSKTALKHAMSCGALWLSHAGKTTRLRRAKKQLQAGDQLHLYYNTQILNAQPSAAQLICDEADYSIWYKPYGMYSQGTKWGDHFTIKRWVEHDLQRTAFIVHRLDRAASGLILLGHDKKTTAALANLFKTRCIEKRYQVIVAGQFPSPDSVRFDQDIDQRQAISHAKVIAYQACHDQSLLEVRIETGRKHQIRRHLSQAGFAIIGDRLYGQDLLPKSDLQLCCSYLSFVCPINGEQKTYQLDSARLPTLPAAG